MIEKKIEQYQSRAHYLSNLVESSNTNKIKTSNRDEPVNKNKTSQPIDKEKIENTKQRYFHSKLLREITKTKSHMFTEQEKHCNL